MKLKSGDSVKLIARRTGAVLGTGTIGRCDERAISIRHDDGALTMVAGLNDPFFRIEEDGNDGA